jgi:hypothetical protein
MFGRTVRIVALFSFCLVPPALAQDSTAAAPDTTVAAPETPPAAAGQKDHAAAVKQSLQESMPALRQYQWLETTVVSLKGEEKSRTQNNCVYGAEGKVQKTPVVAPATEEKKRGLRGKIVENKKEDISAATKEAIALVKQYVPPDPARIQAAKEGGRVAVTPPDAAGQVRLVIKDYLKAGDSLTLDVNAASDRISGLTVATFTDKEKDPVGLKVTFGAFPDGIVYPAQVQLDIAAEKLAISIENTGYKKVGG